MTREATAIPETRKKRHEYHFKTTTKATTITLGSSWTPYNNNFRNNNDNNNISSTTIRTRTKTTKIRELQQPIKKKT